MAMWLYAQTRKPQLSLESSLALAGLGGDVFKTISTSVTNTGHVLVTLRGVSLRVKRDDYQRHVVPYEWMNCAWPVKLAVGERWDAPLIDVQKVLAILREQFSDEAVDGTWEIVTVGRDAYGTSHESKVTIRIGINRLAFGSCVRRIRPLRTASPTPCTV
jgi:hypothetical protein